MCILAFLVLFDVISFPNVQLAKNFFNENVARAVRAERSHDGRERGREKKEREREREREWAAMMDGFLVSLLRFLSPLLPPPPFFFSFLFESVLFSGECTFLMWGFFFPCIFSF
jgi:hypothetical protein